MRSELLRELEDGLLKEKKRELQGLKMQMLEMGEEAEEKADIELTARRKIEELRTVFAVADPKNLQRRVGELEEAGDDVVRDVCLRLLTGSSGLLD